MIADSDPPVLKEYDSVQGDGVLGSERRIEKIEEAKAGEPPLKGVRRILHKQLDKVLPHGNKRDAAKKYRTEGDIEVLNLPKNDRSNNVIEPIEKGLQPLDESANIIEWGDSPPPPPAASAPVLDE